MRTSLLPTALLATCFVVAPAFCLAQQPPASPISADPNDQLATITGTVVSANTGEPLKKAYVTLSQKGSRGDDSGDHPLTATTDATGHFSIDKIPAGSYDLVVARANYLRSHYGQDQLDKPGAMLSLAPGQKVADLLFRLSRTAVITGKVVDEDGEPVRGASVTTLLHTKVRGKPSIQRSDNEDTNDLGEYRIAGLDPGRYSVFAAPPIGYYRQEAPHQFDQYAPVYYSGAIDITHASTIELKSGDEISGIDFVLTPKPPARGYKVRGHVLNSLTDYPDARVVVGLFQRGVPDPSFSSSQKQAYPDGKSGNFEIKDVMPGEYVAAALSYAGGKTRIVTQIVDVSNTDVEGISLVLTRGIDIPIRVALEGKSAGSTADVFIALVPAEDETTINFSGLQSAVAQPDGSFLLKDVSDGFYSLKVSSKCQECYLKSAKSNGIDLLEQGIRVTSGGGPDSIAAVYSSNTGTVTGAVTNKDDLPAAGALVVLVPNADSRQKFERYKTSNTDQYGHFEIRGVPPGRYKAFAWEKVDPGAYVDPDFLRPLESSAESVDIAANEQKSMQLKMIPASDSAN
jgi:protocatechuate 3,4-dioxygenase beta subunit